VGVSLLKGGNISLTKEAPGLTNVVVGLGWDVRSTTGADHDLDASAILLNANGKVISDHHFVFFNNLTSPDGTVEHTGDNLTGEGEGDDEAIKVNLAAMSPDVAKIVFPVSIYDADNRSQNFGQVWPVSRATSASASDTVAPPEGWRRGSVTRGAGGRADRDSLGGCRCAPISRVPTPAH